MWLWRGHPRTISPTSAGANMAHQTGLTGGLMAKSKVMMVDDSDVVLEAGRIVLEENGFDVVTLDNPLLVALAVRREQPDLVLLDVNMPALKGDAVTKI